MFALRYRARVRGLVMIGTIGLMPIGAERRQKTIEWLPQMDRNSIRIRLRRSVFDPALISEDWVEEDYRINNSPGAAESFSALAHYYAGAIENDATCDQLAVLSANLPILLLWGSEDVSVPPTIGAAAHAKIPGSKFVVLPNTAHLPYRENPDAANHVMLEFLARL
jgi:pimeloyl-ACP methyl ester carboxylesterase